MIVLILKNMSISVLKVLTKRMYLVKKLVYVMYMHRECTPLIEKVSLAEYRNSDVLGVLMSVACFLQRLSSSKHDRCVLMKIVFKQSDK